jgi:hypothetical protein
VSFRSAFSIKSDRTCSVRRTGTTDVAGPVQTSSEVSRERLAASATSSIGQFRAARLPPHELADARLVARIRYARLAAAPKLLYERFNQAGRQFFYQPQAGFGC